MDIIKVAFNEGLAPVFGMLVRGAGFLAWGMVIACWCLVVLVFSGRLPWFVRRCI